MAHTPVRRMAMPRLLARAGAGGAVLLAAASRAGAQVTEEFVPEG